MPRRMLAAAVAAVVLALLFTGAGQAQEAPPVPPFTFFGSSPLIDGEPAPNGTIVTAIDETGATILATTVTDGFWVIDVPGTSRAANVRFVVEDFPPSEISLLQAGQLTEVSLSFTTAEPPIDTNGDDGGDTGGDAGDGDGAADGDTGPGDADGAAGGDTGGDADAGGDAPPDVLPNGGSGGLAGFGPIDIRFWATLGSTLSAVLAVIGFTIWRRRSRRALVEGPADGNPFTVAIKADSPRMPQPKARVIVLRPPVRVPRPRPSQAMSDLGETNDSGQPSERSEQCESD